MPSATWAPTTDRTPPTADAIKQLETRKQHQAFQSCPAAVTQVEPHRGRAGPTHAQTHRRGRVLAPSQALKQEAGAGVLGTWLLHHKQPLPSQQTPHRQRRGRLAQRALTPLPLKPARSTPPNHGHQHTGQERGAPRMRRGTDRPPTAAQQERSGVCACTCIDPGSVSSLKANRAKVDISWQQHMLQAC